MPDASLEIYQDIVNDGKRGFLQQINSLKNEGFIPHLRTSPLIDLIGQ